MSIIDKIAGEALRKQKTNIIAQSRAVTPVRSGRLRGTITVIPLKGQWRNGMAITLGRKGLLRNTSTQSGTQVKTRRGTQDYADIVNRRGKSSGYFDTMLRRVKTILKSL